MTLQRGGCRCRERPGRLAQWIVTQGTPAPLHNAVPVAELVLVVLPEILQSPCLDFQQHTNAGSAVNAALCGGVCGSRGWGFGGFGLWDVQAPPINSEVACLSAHCQLRAHHMSVAPCTLCSVHSTAGSQSLSCTKGDALQL